MVAGTVLSFLGQAERRCVPVKAKSSCFFPNPKPPPIMRRPKDLACVVALWLSTGLREDWVSNAGPEKARPPAETTEHVMRDAMRGRNRAAAMLSAADANLCDPT